MMLYIVLVLEKVFDGMFGGCIGSFGGVYSTADHLAFDPYGTRRDFHRYIDSHLT